MDDAGPIHGVSATQNCTVSVCGKLQVEGDDLAKQQVYISGSLCSYLPYPTVGLCTAPPG